MAVMPSADGGLLSAGRLDGGVEHGRGQRSGIGAGIHGGGHAHQAGVEDAGASGDYERDHAQTHERQLAAQVAEEGVARADADRVAEQSKAEAAQQGQVGSQSGVDGAEGEPDEERAGGTEANGAEGYLADGGPQSDDEEDGEQRGGGEDIDDGVQEVGHAPRLASTSLFAEIGPVPRRDRSYSAARSVVLRREIGPFPARDRSRNQSRQALGKPSTSNNAHPDPRGASARALPQAAAGSP